MTLLLMGDINVDTTMNIHKYPSPGGDAFADHISTQPGGGIVNSAASLVALGEKVALVAATGQDVWAEMVLEPLQKLDVDLTRVVRLKQASTGLIFIPIADGERTMFSYRGANQLYHPDWVTAETLQGVSLLHLSSYAFLALPQRDANLKAVQLACQAGIPISLDISLEPIVQQREVFLSILSDLAVCILGQEEAENLVGGKTPDACADLLLEAGVSLVGLKLGRQGCLLATPGGRKRFPIFEVQTVDTTGAGDSFSSGLIYAHHHQLDMDTTGALASALGALATTVYGGGLNLDWRPQLLAFLRQRCNTQVAAAFGDGVQTLLQILTGENEVSKFNR